MSIAPLLANNSSVKSPNGPTISRKRRELHLYIKPKPSAPIVGRIVVLDSPHWWNTCFASIGQRYVSSPANQH
jgi:hypothetical protein